MNSGKPPSLPSAPRKYWLAADENQMDADEAATKFEILTAPTRFWLGLTRRREAGEEREGSAKRKLCRKNKKSRDGNAVKFIQEIGWSKLCY
jgi:hypothetical protein